MTEKVEWEGEVISVQPRIRLNRSFDERNHGLLICTEIRSNRVGYLHSDLTHLHQELLVCNRLFKVIPVVHFSVQMVGHFSVQFDTRV